MKSFGWIYWAIEDSSEQLVRISYVWRYDETNKRNLYGYDVRVRATEQNHTFWHVSRTRLRLSAGLALAVVSQ